MASVYLIRFGLVTTSSFNLVSSLVQYLFLTNIAQHQDGSFDPVGRLEEDHWMINAISAQTNCSLFSLGEAQEINSGTVRRDAHCRRGGSGIGITGFRPPVQHSGSRIGDTGMRRR